MTPRATVVCVYCGRRVPKKGRDSGLDHMPPKVLMPTPYPHGLKRLPICRWCDRTTHEDDQAVATIISFNSDALSDGRLLKDWREKIMASNRKPIKQLREAIQQSRDVLTVDSVSGQVYALDPPAELELAFRRGVERIARGLLYRARPDRPLYHHECRMQSLTVLPKDRLSNLQYLLSQIRWTTTTFPGNRICMDWAFATDVEPGSAVSWVQFHDSTDMLMWFLPPPPDEIIEGPKVPWERGAANLSGSL